MANPNPSRIRSFSSFGLATVTPDFLVVAQPCKLLGMTIAHGGDTEAMVISLRDAAAISGGSTPVYVTGRPIGSAAGSGQAWQENLEGMRMRQGITLEVTGPDSPGDWALTIYYELD